MSPTRHVASLCSLLLCSALATSAFAQDDAAPAPVEKAVPKAPAAKRPAPKPAQPAPPDEAAAPVEQAAPPDAVDAPIDATPVDATPAEEVTPAEAAPVDTAPTDTAPAVTVVHGEPPGSSAACAPSDIARATARGRAALVRVEAPGASGHGFVFHSPGHVATALSIVDAGRGIRVIVDGERYEATVVALDRARDLAVLELETALDVVPLTLAKAPAEVGDPLLLMASTNDWPGRHRRHAKRHHKRHRGHRHHSPAVEVVRQGIVSSRTGMSLRSDAVDRRYDSWGAPAMTCAGRVQAVAISPYSDELVAASALQSLEEDIAGEPVYDGRWSFFHPSIGVVGQMDVTAPDGFEDGDKWIGFSVGTALIGDDRWYFPLRFTATWQVGNDPEEPFSERDGYRLMGSTGLGYRFMLTSGRRPLYLVPTVGIAGMLQRNRLTTLELSAASCEAETCPVQAREVEVATKDWRALPTAGLALQFGFGQVGYQFLFDPEDKDRSFHQLTVGAQW